MKETVLDVLMYLFESFVDSEDEPEPDRNELRDELERAGFGDGEIDRALEWLDGLNFTDVSPQTTTPYSGMRLYDTAELERLSTLAATSCISNKSASCRPPRENWS
jgi:Smg protein